MSEKLTVEGVSKLLDGVTNEAVKDTWRHVFWWLKTNTDEQTALQFTQANAKSAVCKTCGTIDLPAVKVTQKANWNGKCHVGSYCSHCGSLRSSVGFELKKVGV